MLQPLLDPALDLLLLPILIFIVAYAVRMYRRRKKAQIERKYFEIAVKIGDQERAKRRLRRYYRALGGGEITPRGARSMAKELAELKVDQNVVGQEALHLLKQLP